MNKAFVREPEGGVKHCPQCGSLGQPVLPETLSAHLTPEAREQISESALFCPFPTCPVAYFDELERAVTVASLVKPVYPKDPDAPICACFGVTCEDLEDDAKAGVVDRVRDLIRRANSTEARCRIAAANGKSCVADVQRLYLKFRNG